VAGRAAVFLDRDGTLIADRHYLADPAGVALLPGAAAAVARLNAAGIPAVLATNQSGIGRGFFTEAQYRAVHARLLEELAAGGARLDGAYHCPHAPGGPPCPCRKPGTGMFRDAAAEMELDVAASFYVGDRLRDVVPARALGGRGILVRGPETEVEEEGGLGPGLTAVDTLADAVEIVLAALRPGAPRQD
jgi:histidinol-phosphate phosphatase family protein